MTASARSRPHGAGQPGVLPLCGASGPLMARRINPLGRIRRGSSVSWGCHSASRRSRPVWPTPRGGRGHGRIFGIGLAPRDNGWQGYLKCQMLTCVLEGDSRRCLQGLRVRLLDRLGAPVSKTTLERAAQSELCHNFMGGGDHRSWRLHPAQDGDSRHLTSVGRANV